MRRTACHKAIADFSHGLLGRSPDNFPSYVCGLVMDPPMFDRILAHVPPPAVEEGMPFAMLATLLDYDSYLGRCLTGRVSQGSAKVNEQVKAIGLDGKTIETGGKKETRNY